MRATPPGQIAVGQLTVDVELTLAPPDETPLQRHTFLTEGS
jgi:hypothetical protein